MIIPKVLPVAQVKTLLVQRSGLADTKAAARVAAADRRLRKTNWVGGAPSAPLGAARAHARRGRWGRRLG